MSDSTLPSHTQLNIIRACRFQAFDVLAERLSKLDKTILNPYTEFAYFFLPYYDQPFNQTLSFCFELNKNITSHLTGYFMRLGSALHLN